MRSRRYLALCVLSTKRDHLQSIEQKEPQRDDYDNAIGDVMHIPAFKNICSRGEP